MDELKGKLEKHRYHIRKLETLLRMLDNMSVEVNTVRQYLFHQSLSISLSQTFFHNNCILPLLDKKD